MFTVSQALTRLTSGPRNLFITSQGTLSAGQQLQRVNEILEKFYDKGDWRGVHVPVALTSVLGIITLDAAYLRLDGLAIASCNFIVPIKNMSYGYQVGGPGLQDWTEYGNTVALDMGDNSSGLRQYQITGCPDANDVLALTGLARKRFTWITDTSTVVVPDCFGALRTAVLAMNAEDEQATEIASKLWADAFTELDNNHEEFEAPQSAGILQLDPALPPPAYRTSYEFS